MAEDNMKTGTTCIGIQFKDGILIAADMRATGGYIASDSFQKTFDISERIVAATAGLVADAQLLMRIIKGELKLLELRNERKCKVREAAMILNSMQYRNVRTMGSIVSLIVGGYDEKEGFSLYDLSPDGSIINHEGYVVTGSGSVFIRGFIDSKYDSGMSQDQATELVEEAFRLSFKHDAASGGGFVAKVITKDGIEEVQRKNVQTELVGEKQ